MRRSKERQNRKTGYRRGVPLRPGARVVLAAQVPAKGDENRALLNTVAAAIVSAGASVVATIIQRRGASRARRPGGSRMMSVPIQAATFLGRGKAVELATMVQNNDAELVVLCNPLTSTQRRNLEEITGVRVLSHKEVLPAVEDST